MSVRSKARRDEIAAAEQIYRAFRKKRATGWIIQEGKTVSRQELQDVLSGVLEAISPPASIYLLALNAAVEAAHAGKQGWGFALGLAG